MKSSPTINIFVHSLHIRCFVVKYGKHITVYRTQITDYGKIRKGQKIPSDRRTLFVCDFIWVEKLLLPERVTAV